MLTFKTAIEFQISESNLLKKEVQLVFSQGDKLDSVTVFFVGKQLGNELYFMFCCIVLIVSHKSQVFFIIDNCRKLGYLVIQYSIKINNLNY